jgi:hypothetical protein
MIIALKVTNKISKTSVLLTNASGLMVFGTADEASTFGETMYGKDNPHVTFAPVVIGYELEAK